METENYTITVQAKIVEALKKIDKNNQGFLIVIDKDCRVVGTVTDGDIRRGLLKGITINESIEQVTQKDYFYLENNSTFFELIEAFKSPKIDFLPILDQSQKIYNIVTKKQLHLLLIEDIDFNLSFDFFKLSVNKLEHEIYNRPWGFYKTTFLNPYSRAKLIKVYPSEELSLQEHKKREEHWVIIKGKGELTLGETVKTVSAGDYIFVPKGCKHKIRNQSQHETLMISEVQLGEYFGEDDIIRYDDKYGRI